MGEKPDQRVIHPPAFIVDSETLRAIVREAVSDVLIRVGVDTQEAEEIRKDMAYLRSWRETMDKVRDASLTTAIKWATLGLISAILLGLGVKLGFIKLPG